MPHHLILLLLLLLTLTFSPLILCLNQEGLYLHQAKLSFDDPNSVLANWNPSDATPCKWSGVVCDPTTASVVSLDLSSSNLSGPFPSILCRLKNLLSISFYDNFINSTLRGDHVVLCQSLEHLNLAQNYLTGELPRTLADLPNLKYLDLTGNNFSGAIPESFGTFQKLEVLALVENLLDGTIPAFLGNVSSLKQLNLSYNPFSPGRIPPELGNLTNLEVLWLTETNLIGEILDTLSRLGRLTDLDLAYNSLSGAIPSSLTELKSLVQLELYNNSLTGELPSSGWSNMTSLRRIDVSMNELSGYIPAELCDLPIESLNLYENNLRGQLPDGIANSPNLYELRLFQNHLSGRLPPNLGKRSPLKWIDVSTNKFSGPLPENLCLHGALEELLLIENSISGEIPASLGECRSLVRLRLGHNSFSGEVPERLWGLPHVSLLELAENSFSGGISKNIAAASNLSQLILSGNYFSGSLPAEIGVLDGLLEISINDNKLSGSLPSSVVKLGQLVKLDLHNNGLSGEIPKGIRSLKRLNELNLANNGFSGDIPDEIGDLSVLNYLDLSGNELSGKIPLGLQNLKLNRLDLSNNSLSGIIPAMYAKEMYKDSFLGNPGLCGDTVGSCNGKGGFKEMSYIWMLRSIFIVAGLVLIVGSVWFYFKYRNLSTTKRSMDRSKWTLMSFHKLRFSENEILDALDEDNVIGTGASGKVYKVVLSTGEAVAVKKLWGRPKSAEDSVDLEKGNGGFDAEVETLGKIRHKNIIKLWCCCSTKDCKLLVYEYMPNGSLGDLLHSTKGGLLDWPIRFKIALDAADGLSYLHHDCAPAIVHRDIKSNNILLDSEFGALVADFGVAKMVDVNAKGTHSMSGIAGSCGYIAPVNVLIMHPIDPEFGEKDLVKWVCTTVDQKDVEHVIDPRLDPCFKDEICRVLNIGLQCTSPLPINRPSMRSVVKMMQAVANGTQHKTVGKDGKLLAAT
ncbi:hypothetical protein SASPL_144289 [Salvia splendens]|uniref:Protein kinase domain-containing protein n=1 Tax=Salvia splendens TaxID=180675 RepID=A0A8X8Z742_SALSN|nr:hypothetical protein SASPL_144289 [Salvia splendens]